MFNIILQDLMSFLIVVVALIVIIWGSIAAYNGRHDRTFRLLDGMYVAIGVFWFTIYAWRLLVDADDATIVAVGTWLYRPSALLTLTAIAADRIYRANGTLLRLVVTTSTKLSVLWRGTKSR